MVSVTVVNRKDAVKYLVRIGIAITACECTRCKCQGGDAAQDQFSKKSHKSTFSLNLTPWVQPPPLAVGCDEWLDIKIENCYFCCCNLRSLCSINLIRLVNWSSLLRDTVCILAKTGIVKNVKIKKINARVEKNNLEK